MEKVISLFHPFGKTYSSLPSICHEKNNEILLIRKNNFRFCHDSLYFIFIHFSILLEITQILLIRNNNFRLCHDSLYFIFIHFAILLEILLLPSVQRLASSFLIENLKNIQKFFKSSSSHFEQSEELNVLQLLQQK